MSTAAHFHSPYSPCQDTYSRLDAEEQHARRLKGSDQSLQRSTDLLTNARRTVEETEEIGLATVGTMHGQREQLIKAQGTVQETNAITQDAAKTLNNMARRAAHNRMFLYGIITILLFLIGYMVYDIFK